MEEVEWVSTVVSRVKNIIQQAGPTLNISEGIKLPYANEILSYKNNEPNRENLIRYETDMLITEQLDDNVWKPSLVIEAKVNSVTTHDAITYSQKASTHKNVHPYLRYGILIGNRKHYPLPGRLFRHGAHFDFMLSWVAYKPTQDELDRFVQLILHEVSASRQMEEITLNSRSRNRKHFVLLHRPLHLE